MGRGKGTGRGSTTDGAGRGSVGHFLQLVGLLAQVCSAWLCKAPQASPSPGPTLETTLETTLDWVREKEGRLEGQNQRQRRNRRRMGRSQGTHSLSRDRLSTCPVLGEDTRLLLSRPCFMTPLLGP